MMRTHITLTVLPAVSFLAAYVLIYPDRPGRFPIGAPHCERVVVDGRVG